MGGLTAHVAAQAHLDPAPAAFRGDLGDEPEHRRAGRIAERGDALEVPGSSR